MAQFKKTYQDTLRALKKEQQSNDTAEEKEQNKTVALYDPYESYIFDISNEDLDPVDTILLYKNNFAKLKHTYTFTMPSDAKYLRRQSNPYLDIEAILYTMIPDATNVDDDFLTGYYIAKYHLDLPKIITSYHAGISKDSLTQGIYYATLSQQTDSLKKTKWQMFGCDGVITKKYEALYKNGILKPCNIYNTNTSNSIKIQLSEVVDHASIDLYTCDVRSASTLDVLKQLLLIFEFLSMKSRVVLRLPTNWQQFYTSMSTTLLFIVGQFKTVKIFKTPWGVIPKYYLILHDMKEPMSSKKIASLLTYITALSANGNIPLISSTYYSVDEQELLMQNISLAYINMMSYDVETTIEDAIQTWTSLIQ